MSVTLFANGDFPEWERPITPLTMDVQAHGLDQVTGIFAKPSSAEFFSVPKSSDHFERALNLTGVVLDHIGLALGEQ